MRVGRPLTYFAIAAGLVILGAVTESKIIITICIFLFILGKIGWPIIGLVKLLRYLTNQCILALSKARSHN